MSEAKAMRMRSLIVQAMGNLFWWDSWASHVEEHGCEHIPGGSRIEEIAPTTPREAFGYAKDAAAKIERASGRSLDALYAQAVTVQANLTKQGQTCSWWQDPNPERFGECLAYAFMGAGVSWNDDHPEVSGLTVPYGESMMYPRNCRKKGKS